MITYLKLDTIAAIPTAHGAGNKKILSVGHPDLTRLTQVAYGSLGAGEEIPSHQHPDMEENFYFTKGTGIMLLNNEEYKLSEGVFLIVPAKTEHFLKCIGEEALEFFYFGLQVYEKVS